MYRHPLLESLHICFTLPIVVLDNDLDMLKAYPFQQVSCLQSDLKPHLDKVWRQKSLFPFTLLRTPKGQMLALYPFQNYLFIFGPFWSASPAQTLRPLADLAFIPQHCLAHEGLCPCQHITDVGHLLHLIHYFFTGHLHLMEQDQESLTQEIFEDIRKELSESLIQQCNLYEDQHFDFEFHLLESVKKGDLKEVRSFLSQSVTPKGVTKDLRSEKNYSILIFEKLSQLAISMGVDPVYAHHTRDYYMSKCEACLSIQDVLALRESAIILFTQKIGRINNHSYTVAKILRYIHQNLSQKLMVEDIAKQFNFSESTIRKLFRKEMNCSLQQYISQKKMEEAKVMLRNQNNVTEVSNSLGYADLAHFSRTFKAHVGLSPKQYQRSPIKDIL
ncbi:YSIRK-targeted surface antigen transcriptional regulator [Streptococcus uberis]|uniref:YSIRK-targeted surface antigen transcriptional regulator n=1 Tax=Streptococcus uberis TaxID=1349 RepID=UPI00214F6DEC|nr:YSIRK-targeted surface antigen transcriptional regulator [Streptococcus uberis]MCR4253580.1 YSIRK-targeted surface antigen transcriptional regulator [Streptococcus uberis]MCR4255440.1 YSIRK-targeted surface antigen transcriptional regulator [Streptococcus uberis]MCR4260256.1 YSIRK-targeted surface antigen transcriptional regulator [Streptococcus uberis]MCR4262623.1 YSIRK-targeted surface antigen transcriptional regulator [Streptococcus uberis]